MVIKYPFFKNRKILITAGPTWVAIDPVRVISNTATSETGIRLARFLAQNGARVTLLLGPGENSCVGKGIKVIRFRFFDELKNLLCHELKGSSYDAAIHSAAVSDFKPDKVKETKVASRRLDFKINLVPTPKLIDLFKCFSPSMCLVGFKFEPNAAQDVLLKQARTLRRSAQACLVVANTRGASFYKAFVVGENSSQGPFKTKSALVSALVKSLEKCMREGQV